MSEEFIQHLDAADGLFFELVSGVVRVAEEGGAGRAFLGDGGNDGSVVVVAAAATAVEGSSHEFSASGVIFEIGERGLAAGVDEGDEELAVMAGGFSGGGGRGDRGVAQASEFGAGIKEHAGRVAFFEDVLGERRLECREFGVERAEFGFFDLAEFGAGANEVLKRAPQQTVGFRVEREAGAGGVQT